MPLPKIETPVFELDLPSTGEKIKFRPFLVKEQKNLLIAQQTENALNMQNALAQILSDCTFNKISAHDIPMFDVEYLFLKIRCKSVGENIQLSVLCPDDDETRVDVNINLDELEVQVTEDHTNEIEISKDIKLFMRYPYLKDMLGLEGENSIDAIFTLLKRCVNEIHHGDDVYNKVDIAVEEMNEFVDNLSTDAFERIGKFFETMPKIVHILNVENPKTKKKGEVVIQGLESFFV